MTPILEDAVLETDLDCQNYDLKNVGMLDPVPAGLVAIDDPRLTEGRTPVAGSVTNDSVNASAAIDQSKLNLNGSMPASWLVASPLIVEESPVAIEGSAAEFLSRKGVANGYAGLDSSGQIISTSMSPGTALGSVTSVGLNVPAPLHITSPVPPVITTSGTFVVGWNNPPDPSFFGATGELDHGYHFRDPEYLTRPMFEELMGLTPASKFTTGEFALARLPMAIYGTTPLHQQGIIPDPGTGDRNMYLGRDMNWHHFVVNDPATAYQPDVPDVTIVLDDWTPHEPTVEDPSLVKANITIRSLLKGSFLFYRVTPEGDTPGAFTEAHHDDTPDDAHITLEVNEHDFIEAYASRQGYNDSKVEEWEVITPITDLGLS